MRPSPAVTAREPVPVWPYERVFTRRRLVILGLIVLLALPVTSVWVRAAHPRDEADFLLAAGSVESLTSLSETDLVAEGDFACQWLSQQERALWNHGSWFDRGFLLERYLKQTRPVQIAHWGPPREWFNTRGAVANAAWSQLCGGTWWWHRPHGPRGAAGSGGGD